MLPFPHRSVNPFPKILLLLSLLLLSPPRSTAAGPARVVRDIEFARVGEISLALDLHLPPGEVRSPLIVWVHGGAWRTGSKDQMPLGKLTGAGYAIASISYRLSTQAKFPAQVHDIKAAVRFLRSQDDKWHLPTERVVVAGASAGGHLAALAGVSNQVEELEGAVGENRDQSSTFDGVISFYGASNLTTILSQSTPHGLSVRVPALGLLLGDQPENVPDLARLASPVFHVNKGDPPLLLLHGDQDPQMPINQAHELAGAYRNVECDARFHVVHGAAHGGSIFYQEKQLEVVRAFLAEIR